MANPLNVMMQGATKIEANKSIIQDIYRGWKKADSLGAPVRIAESWANGGGFKSTLGKELLDAEGNLLIGRTAATAGTAWVAGNAGVGMIKGVFTDRNGNFDMPLIPGI